MAKLQIVGHEKAARIEAPTCGQGRIRSRAYFNKEADPLCLQLHELTADTVLNVGSPGTDTLVYVWMGTVAVQGIRLVERSSLIVECGAFAEMSAVENTAT